MSPSTVKKTAGARSTPAKSVKTEKPAKAPAAKAAAKAVPAADTEAPARKSAPKAAATSKPAVQSGAGKTPAVPPSMPKATAPASSPARRVADPDAAEAPVRKIDPKLANAWKTKSARELTDAEVLAMPDAEYMNEKQLEFFRAKLEVLKDDLLSNAGETTEHLREDTSIVPDPADRATIEEEHALELRTRDRERKLLKKITQAIARIDAGDYGFCDETGEPIGLGRLMARPTATLTLEAQQRRELKQKMYGD